MNFISFLSLGAQSRFEEELRQFLNTLDLELGSVANEILQAVNFRNISPTVHLVYTLRGKSI